ncbi:hypothetical protein B296_00046467 [Ensete ventricosum]|uniref:Uncharacterized protein n=1 Tax=Ensete ventricosum TaxID=4639 RepID=A0A426X732_ENSVE|nr:hypothetical protein B296_00046467 [Ensete ventricosum]
MHQGLGRSRIPASQPWRKHLRPQRGCNAAPATKNSWGSRPRAGSLVRAPLSFGAVSSPPELPPPWKRERGPIRHRPLERGDAGRELRKLPRHRHENPIVHRDEAHDGDADEDLQGCRRHFEVEVYEAYPPVQGAALLGEERRRLAKYHSVSQAGRPCRQQSKQPLGAFSTTNIPADEFIVFLGRRRGIRS